MKRNRDLSCLGGLVSLTALCICGSGRSGVAAEPPFMQKPSAHHLRIVCYNVNWDAIFEDGDPMNHQWRDYDKSDEFVRVISALKPDILCVQEINSDRNPQDVADILDAAIPIGGGQTWRSHSGSDNVILSKYDLTMQATDTLPSTNRGQAMALVDLPDAEFDRDLYLMNAHFKAAGGSSNIARRQQHADAIVNWMRDIKSAGGNIDLPVDTAVVVLGDLNVYDTDPHYHLTTLITGDIVNEATYGPDLAPDWDATDLADALPLHNGVGPEFYTWRDDTGGFNPGDLDHVLYTDSVMRSENMFVLNTASMSAGDLAATGLQAADVALDLPSGKFDHLPLVVDFLMAPADCANECADLNGDLTVDLLDFATFASCFNLGAWRSRDCMCADMNRDLAVNLADFTTFAIRFGWSPDSSLPDCSAGD